MTKVSQPARPPLFLGIDAGGTRTVAVQTDDAGHLLKRIEAGPANLRLLTDVQLLDHLRHLRAQFARPAAIGIGMAGVRHAQDARRILWAAEKAWPRVPCAAAHDLETALCAAEFSSDGPASTRVVVLSGTGSCCYGRSPAGRTAKVGGWGHLLGDKGSGYEIGLRALKAVVYYFDRDGIWPRLGQRILRATQLNEPEDLIGWAQSADKKNIAALAIEVFAAWPDGDKIARDILNGAAHSLAKDAATCAKRLVRPGTPVEFVFTGSVLLKQPRFAGLVRRLLRPLWPKGRAIPLRRESVWGAIHLAKRQLALSKAGLADSIKSSVKRPKAQRDEMPAPAPPVFASLPPTEQRNPRSKNLSRLPLAKAIALMLSEEANVPAAIFAERQKIENAIRWIVRALKKGGRLFYVGAGTSGRLGVLDASECPPTFRASPEQVQGIIAGGQPALWTSVEGAEDDAGAGARAMRFRGIGQSDVVIGIAASGRTPFVWGALREAKQRRATAILLTFNPGLKIPLSDKPNLVIAPNTGPEVLTGSTRLKAGTATKLVLNTLTTLSMVRLGKVVSNLMVDLNPANVKLRDRAARIVQELARVDYASAQLALEKTGWVVKAALANLNTRPSRAKPSRP
ncbi:MAG: N-acetylmuramic acid 6-phosphate etherase [Verrucomicrobia bacterium]|nr:N-acetylmuramic acid 6-phosphate etherase [Verrucomicrobiota bacterium]